VARRDNAKDVELQKAFETNPPCARETAQNGMHWRSQKNGHFRKSHRASHVVLNAPFGTTDGATTLPDLPRE